MHYTHFRETHILDISIVELYFIYKDLPPIFQKDKMNTTLEISVKKTGKNLNHFEHVLKR